MVASVGLPLLGCRLRLGPLELFLSRLPYTQLYPFGPVPSLL